ncbi:hypothetical protein [Pseudovibrio sp. Ad37]|uniref:hypothetical protein n=1 Tax=Pseudovibrio sp. Ad37 TaxID=989422 RepID=UPI0007AE3998|nr:hypothetical protein [Pseudovibrio sp. Ad37]KZL24220.1 hypothetical protein PsAD37_02791 [Pseudovibrio sp. Ad37]
MKHSVTRLVQHAKDNRVQYRRKQGEREHRIFENEAANFLNEKAILQRRADQRWYKIAMWCLWLLPWIPLFIFFKA